jgi:zinc D-Ala-D-Ala carboxypeptidase
VRYFKIEEFDCRETGENNMERAFLDLLDELRHSSGFPFVITSGYRSPRHSIESAKPVPGKHAQGIAADIAVSNASQRHTLLKHAFNLGFTGIGVADTYIHLDTRGTTPVVWTY